MGIDTCKWLPGLSNKTNPYSFTYPRSQGSSNSSEGDALDSGVHRTILRTRSWKPFLLETSRFLSESSQDTERIGFRHFQLPVVCILGWGMQILGIKYLPLSSKQTELHSLRWTNSRGGSKDQLYQRGGSGSHPRQSRGQAHWTRFCSQTCPRPRSSH